MGYSVTSVANEYHKDTLPPFYTWMTSDLLKNTGWKMGTIQNYCTRLYNPLPHAVIRKGLHTTRYFNPREVAVWMKAEAVRKANQRPQS